MRIHHSLLVAVGSLLAIACEDGVEPDIDDASVAPSIDAEAPSPDVALLEPDASLDAAPGIVDATPASSIDAVPPVSFAADVVPILLARCGGCHLKDSAGAGGLSMGTMAQFAYQTLVDQDTVLANPTCGDLKRVDPMNHDPMQSSLYVKLIGPSCGKQMPAGMMPVPLTPEQIELIGRWIAEGALDN
jgi:hypothetical protein